MTSTDPTVEIARLDYEQYKAEALVRIGFSAEHVHSSRKGLTLANGGAIVALFTFIGNTAAHYSEGPIWGAFVCFSTGLALTLLSAILGSFSQGYYYRYNIALARNEIAKIYGTTNTANPPEREARLGDVREHLAVAATLLSLVAFIGGSAFALHGVLGH